ncbi:MAG: transcription-repair coupling factor, partial [Oscillospiraceae bacterium]|nr:transcription-repair coupling factor [Oscillospiraceae bacterium]
MEKLLDVLKSIPEYTAALEALQQGQNAAITGIGQLNRSHMIAGLYAHTDSPLVVICQDDMAAHRLCEELKAFLGTEFPILPSRELTLYDSSVVSRGWEQKRLRQMYDLLCGKTRLQIMAWDAVSLRTIPPGVLKDATFIIQVGKQYDLDTLITKLSHIGYSRCGMVEGPGQFAVRGGILDLFSPAAELPIRAEFFGDELDTMGYFDPDTQRRIENIDEITILPVAEVQPRLHPNGLDGLCEDILHLIVRQNRRKNPNQDLIKTLEKDLEKYQNGVQNPASDRYMALIYPEFAT